ncbi:MAG: hypothetical protein IJ748_06490 [Bacteroidales bacterium]|nr:hypothetical protein [Bacteroidales bacterium]
MKRYLYFILSALCFLACKDREKIVQFVPITECSQQDTVYYDMDLTNGVFSGIVIPSKDSLFHFSFKLRGYESKQYYYKIFWQNISYAFPDDDSLSYENFYGSWEDTEIGFKPVTSSETSDSFRIVGNPRNEKLYFGQDFPPRLSEQEVEEICNKIRADNEWFKSIKEKAVVNKTTIEDQLRRDAVWIAQSGREAEGNVNRRERRNPRTGVYEFMIVVVHKSALDSLPDYVKNISLKDENGKFVNPFAYFLSDKKKNEERGIYSLVAKQKLKTRAVLDVESGVFLNTYSYPGRTFEIDTKDSNVADNDRLYRYAHFEQYYHNIDQNRTIKQVQQLADITGDGFTLEDFLNNQKNSNTLKTKNIHPVITDRLGETVRLHKSQGNGNSYIELINPGNDNIISAKKESVGIKTRIGFTYGKYRAKIKFPPILNKYGVWNGLTNAFWLIFQSEYDWNLRREAKTGYAKMSANGFEKERQAKTHYSEIDIEMVKTNKQWSPKDLESDSLYDALHNNMFIFASTNWDLACNDNGFITPQHLKFFSKYGDKTFLYNRWNANYRALTSKVEVSNDIFLEPYYYFEIEWKPKEIIWRLGKDPQNMVVVGYMSDKFTSIPNNQMVQVITQEFHYADFWPPVLFEQGLLPYPSEDIKGRVYEIIIE